MKAENENSAIAAPFFPVGAAFLRNPREHDGGFLDPQRCADWAKDFIALVSKLHRTSPSQYPGYGFWNWDEAPDEFWQALAETDVFVEPVAAPRAEALISIAEPLLAAQPYASAPAAMRAASPAAGWAFSVQRLRSERREGEGFARTVGAYSVFHDGAPQPQLSGMTVERQGPGDNGLTGKREHRCIAAGSYPVRAHASPKYRTTGYLTTGAHPRPALEVGDTGDRTEILVHPADGYASSIGCINLAGQLADADSDIALPDSVSRVIAVVEDLRSFSGGALRFAEDASILNARIVIADAAAAAPDLTASSFEPPPQALSAASYEPALQAAPAAVPTDCLVYEQSSGRMLVRQSGRYDTIGVGYSGSLSGGGKNDPRKQCEQDIGPIPRGLYKIGPPGPGPSPYSLRLTPDPSNDMCGRSNFLIHGDSISHPGNASEGCIILSRSEREAIVQTGLKLLVVTDSVAPQSVTVPQAAATPARWAPVAPQGAQAQQPLCSVGPRKILPLAAAVTADPSRASAILETHSKWANGTVLHYCFFTQGQYAIAADQADAVRQAFAKWKAVGIGLNFKEVTQLSEAEVRIGYIAGVLAVGSRTRRVDPAVDRADHVVRLGFDHPVWKRHRVARVGPRPRNGARAPKSLRRNHMER